MQIIPPMSTSGLWTLKPPFNTLLTTGTPYTLIAVRRLTDIIAAGGDPQTDYYTPNALDNGAYLVDIADNVSVLSLQDDAGNVAYVPSSYVNNYPDIGGVPYRVLALAINIGAIPDSLNLAALTDKITADVLDLIGVTAITNIVSLSVPVMLTSVDAATTEAARQANIGTAMTDYARYLQAKNERDSARQELLLLQQYVLTNRTLLGI